MTTARPVAAPRRPRCRPHVLAALLLASSLLWGGCESAEPEAPPGEERIPLQTIHGYHTVETQMGELQWELWGRTAERFPGEETLHLQGVRMIFYREGVKDATLTSKLGTVDESTHNMTARGEVYIVTETARTLSSDILHWDNQRELIHTEAFVRATDGDQVLTGYGMETDPNMTDLVIKRQVEGELPAATGRAEEGREP